MSIFKQKICLCFLSLAIMFFASTVFVEAQRPADRPIDTKTTRAVIEKMLKLINEKYVIAEDANKIVAAIKGRLDRGEYDSITSMLELTDKLGDHLYAACKDVHLGFGYAYKPSPVLEEHPETAAEKEEAFRDAQAVNFGFEKVERLQGNIGYIDMRRFVRPDFAAETFTAAMTFLSNTDALIIDLRNSSGGSPEMVTFIASYFLGDEPVHLLDAYERFTNKTYQAWSLPYVPGKRYLNKDVFFLTSKRTRSAAEGLPYELQALKRAIVVGEKTRGGAHQTISVRLHPNFALFLPTTRVISPQTNTNWEGVGIKPDIAVPADEALKRAHVEALERLSEKVSAEKKKELQQLINELKIKPESK